MCCEEFDLFVCWFVELVCDFLFEGVDVFEFFGCVDD